MQIIPNYTILAVWHFYKSELQTLTSRLLPPILDPKSALPTLKSPWSLSRMSFTTSSRACYKKRLRQNSIKNIRMWILKIQLELSIKTKGLSNNWTIKKGTKCVKLSVKWQASSTLSSSETHLHFVGIPSDSQGLVCSGGHRVILNHYHLHSSPLLQGYNQQGQKHTQQRVTWGSKDQSRRKGGKSATFPRTGSIFWRSLGHPDHKLNTYCMNDVKMKQSSLYNI